MNEAYKSNRHNWVAMLVILAIAIGSPLLLHFLLKPKDTPQPVAVQQVQDHAQIPLVVTQQVFSGIQVVPQIITQQILQVITQEVDRPVIIQQMPVAKPVETKLETQWLGSPVTQVWIWDRRKQIWENDTTYENSFRSSPTIILGLRSDGTVVWRKSEIRL